MKMGDAVVLAVGGLITSAGLVAMIDIIWPGTIRINAVNVAKAIGVSLLGIVVVIGLAMVFAVLTGKKFWEQD